MRESTDKTQDERLFGAVLLFNSKVMGMILGLILGLFIFVVTNWLVIKGGHRTASGEYVVGPHLQLLSQFFIGYKVSFIGSVIGFAYGFAIGTIGGAAAGWIYNKIAQTRS